jgi:uncharacterized membrane protein HdeD (DUF308 family)
MVRFFLALASLLALTMIGMGIIQWLPTATDSSALGRAAGFSGLFTAIAGVFLLTLCAGLDELIRLANKVERNTRPAPHAPNN